MTQWEKIKTEYITGEKSYQFLAKKYGVPYPTLRDRARCDHWVEGRKQHREATMAKSLDIIAQQQAQDLAQVDQLADALLTKLSTAIDQLELQVISHKEKGETEDVKWEKTYEEAAPGGMVDRQGIRTLAASLKDLKQVKALQSQLERLEQEARIRKLQKDGKEDTAQSVTVTMDDETQQYSV